MTDFRSSTLRRLYRSAEYIGWLGRSKEVPSFSFGLRSAYQMRSPFAQIADAWQPVLCAFLHSFVKLFRGTCRTYVRQPIPKT